MSFVILLRRRHLDNTTFFVFLESVILKGENNSAKTSLRKKITYSSWSSPEAKFLVRGFEVAQET